LFKGKIEGDLYPIVRKLGSEEFVKNKAIMNKIKLAYEYLSNIVYVDSIGSIFGGFTKRMKKTELMVNYSDEVKKFFKHYDEFPIYDMFFNTDELGEKRAFYKLETTDVELPLAVMSEGMKSHSELLSVMYHAKPGSLIIIDELERNLHPIVAKKFINSLNEYFDIQLIFTSHNTHLMQTMRPDQIYFSRINYDKYTSYYEKLCDINPNIRRINNLEKMYLGGSFDD
jgi:predicted ATP-dependent endonuclease of OLD family